jgi:hypothetical protein
MYQTHHIYFSLIIYCMYFSSVFVYLDLHFSLSFSSYNRDSVHDCICDGLGAAKGRGPIQVRFISFLLEIPFLSLFSSFFFKVH